MENGSTKIIILLFLILISLIAGGFYTLDRIGLLDVASYVMPYVYKIPYLGDYLQPEVFTGEMLRSEELELIEISLQRQENLINERENHLKEKEKEIEQREQELEVKERDLFLKEQALKRQVDERDAKEDRLNQLAFYYSNMRPVDSARKLEVVDKFLVVEILNRIEDQTTVAIILQFMNDEFSEEITRLIGN
jgi:flagellar motility protein MotE (MotC chaperone)